MAKTKGALFSLQATGSFAGVVNYSFTNGKQVARLKANSMPPPTDQQVTHRAKIKDCSISWKNLTTVERAKWTAVALNNGITGYFLYTREWCIQRSTLASPPLRPYI